MAVIIPPPPPLETLIISLLPPAFLPPRDEEAGRAAVLPAELVKWQELLARTISQIGTALDDEAEAETEEAGEREDARRRLAEGVARWDLGEEDGQADPDETDALDGWVVEDPTTRKEITSKLAILLPSFHSK